MSLKPRRSTVFRVVLVTVMAAAMASIGSPAWAARTPQTFIDSSPAAATTSTSASFTFHSNARNATFTCQLDGGASTSCTSPVSYINLADGSHTFSVYATYFGVSDKSPATYTWLVDTHPPTAPSNLAATSPTSTSIALTWTAGTDNTGVTGNVIYRDGSALATVGAVTSYSDSTVTAGSSYTYTVAAVDAAGNTSPQSAPVATSSTAASTTTTNTYASQLTRSPYLTDLVGLNVIVNFGTDRSATAASVSFGPVVSGTCTVTSTVAASSITVSVNGIYEYQWKANLALPQAGTYCYRPYLGSVDLLGSYPSPQFVTQVPVGSTEAYTFDVLGDWGQANSTPNVNQTNVMSQIAASGARFAITVGDNGYPSGSQANYGDLQQSGANLSAVFGVGQWGVPGASIPVFPALGNHGLARSDAVHPQFANWPQDAAVATSNGSYQRTYYPSVNGSTAADYPSPWYAFSVGTARFYILDAAWPDNNVGTGTVYSDEWLSHWQQTSAEYQWLLNDLQTHPSGMKFAFFHYPLYSDQPSESSDSYLQGVNGLEGLLQSHGVGIVFNGHAHIYQRSAGLNGMVAYVTGGGGATAQSTGSCSSNDMYAIGWSYTNNHGTACGAATPPTSDAQVYHFLKVDVNGDTVTVTPTDSTGATFDVQTYTFATAPNTYIDSAPAAGTTSTTATFSFHASTSPATFACSLDGAAPTACSSPVSYSGLAQGAHTFSVDATANGVADPQPATASWTVDYMAPSLPGSFAATASSPFSVGLSWTASTDNTGVTYYDVYRDGALYASVSGTSTSYTDTSVLGGSTHSYAVQARDIADNVSGLTSTITVTTPVPPPPLFSDGFESGNLSAWTTTSGLAVESSTVHNGSYAAEGNTTTGAAYAKKTLSGTYPDAFARVWFNVVSQTSQVNLLRFRDASGGSLGYLYIATSGQLGFHDDSNGTNTLSAVTPSTGWHALELEFSPGTTAGATGIVQVWLDDVLVTDLSSTAIDIGTAPVGQMQIGEVQSGQTYDVVYDDVAFGTSRLGSSVDNTPPSTPTNVTAVAGSSSSVTVSWTASTDNVGVASYTVLRDGAVVGSTDGTTTSLTDSTVSAATTYSYTVQAADAAGNLSALSSPATVTTPANTVAPFFTDGFESGSSNWSPFNLTIESATVHSGSYAAEGNASSAPAYAKTTFSSSVGDVFVQLAFDVSSNSSQVTLVRLRDAGNGSGGYVYLTKSGRLGFRADQAGWQTTSTVKPAAGWHVLEVEMAPNGSASTVNVWLDGTLVSALSGTVNLGTAGPVTTLQIGDTAKVTYDVVWDDVVAATSRIGN